MYDRASCQDSELNPRSSWTTWMQQVRPGSGEFLPQTGPTRLRYDAVPLLAVENLTASYIFLPHLLSVKSMFKICSGGNSGRRCRNCVVVGNRFLRNGSGRRRGWDIRGWPSLYSTECFPNIKFLRSIERRSNWGTCSVLQGPTSWVGIHDNMLYG